MYNNNLQQQGSTYNLKPGAMNVPGENNIDPNTKFTISITKKEHFPAMYGTGIFSATSLSMQIINPLFSEVYKDFYGSTVVPSSDGRTITVKLFFHPGQIINQKAPEVGFNNIADSNISKQENILKQLSAIENRLSSKDKFTPTKELHEGLIEYLIGYNKSRTSKQLWNGKIFEIPHNSFSGIGTAIEKCIVDISLEAIIREVYGNLDEDGSYYYYMITPSLLGTPSPFNMQIGGVQNNWVYIISQLSGSKYEQLAKENNFPIPGTNPNIVTGIVQNKK